MFMLWFDWNMSNLNILRLEFVDDDNALSSSSSGLRMKLEDTEGAKQEEVDSDNNDTMEEEATQNILSALFG